MEDALDTSDGSWLMPTSEQCLVTVRGTFEACFCAVIFASLVLGAQSFQWDWRQSEWLTPKQSLRHAKVTRTERAAIARAIANQLRPDIRDIDSEQQLEDIALDTRVKMVDLNGEGTPEVIAQGMGEQACSPTGNCFFWIFQKSHHEYKLLVSLEGIQTFTIERTRSHGFSDIVVASHDSATSSTLTILRYSEGRYHDVACYDADWQVVEGDTVRVLKEPRITACDER
jgi:hypothetical protein